MRVPRDCQTTSPPPIINPLPQLDHDLKYTVPSGGGLDLSFLAARLVPPSMVHEEDAPWDFDSLLQEVTLEFTAEAEAKADAAKADREARLESKGPAAAAGVEAAVGGGDAAGKVSRRRGGVA